jgi:hypothetical protein
VRHREIHIQCVEGIISLEIKRSGREAENTYLTPKLRMNVAIPPVYLRLHRINRERFTLSSISSKMGTVLQHNVVTTVGLLLFLFLYMNHPPVLYNMIE